jgi:hypothetical protein
MKAYLLITGVLFALVGSMHLFLLFDRWPHERVENGVLGPLAMGLGIWGLSLIWRRPAR